MLQVFPVLIEDCSKIASTRDIDLIDPLVNVVHLEPSLPTV